MNDSELRQRLSRISTQWSLLFQARQGPTDAAAQAQCRLMQRYGGAVYRYLLGIVRDPDVADDLVQEFALRFLQGDFRRADPERGRFRDFLKMSLRHLAVDHYRRQRTLPQALPADDALPSPSSQEDDELDRRFLDSWRAELLQRAWEGLAHIEEKTGQLCHTVLRFRADHPDVSSGPMAEQLSAQTGKPLTATGVRQLLHRAREKFADLLSADVTHSLADPTPEQVQQELIDLGLFEYCRPLLERREG